MSGHGPNGSYEAQNTADLAVIQAALLTVTSGTAGATALLASLNALPPASLLPFLTAILNAAPATATPGSGTLVNNGGVPTIA